MRTVVVFLRFAIGEVVVMDVFVFSTVLGASGLSVMALSGLAHRGPAIATLREQIECLGQDAVAGRGRSRFRRAGGVDSHALD